MLTTIAQILRETARELEQLGSQLCEDPAIVVSHMHALQAIDVMVQRHSGLAAVLESQCEAEEVERMTLEALRDRLRLHKGFSDEPQSAPVEKELPFEDELPLDEGWWPFDADEATVRAATACAGSLRDGAAN